MPRLTAAGERLLRTISAGDVRVTLDQHQQPVYRNHAAFPPPTITARVHTLIFRLLATSPADGPEGVVTLTALGRDMIGLPMAPGERVYNHRTGRPGTVAPTNRAYDFVTVTYDAQSADDGTDTAPETQDNHPGTLCRLMTLREKAASLFTGDIITIDGDPRIIATKRDEHYDDPITYRVRGGDDRHIAYRRTERVTVERPTVQIRNVSNQVY